MEPLTGRTVTLRSGGYAADVVEVGAGLRGLRRGGRDVVVGYGPDEMSVAARGQLLIPWPNRVEDGAYDFDDTHHQLALSEAAKHNASHGLLRWVNWRLAEESATRAVWTYRLHPQSGYPFLLDVTVTYVLGDDGLDVAIEAHNAGETAAPYAHGAHPYLTVGRRVDECELTVPADTYCAVDSRGLPGAVEPVTGGPYDFTTARPIGATVIDNPFGDLRREGEFATATLRDPDTDRVATLRVGPAYAWLQVFTGDTLASGARESVAVEPMTSPPNSFRSGIDLIRLGAGRDASGRLLDRVTPDETHRGNFSIRMTPDETHRGNFSIR